MRRVSFLLSMVALAACAGGDPSGRSGYPALLPFEQIQAITISPDVDPSAAILARRAALQASADALRNTPT